MTVEYEYLKQYYDCYSWLILKFKVLEISVKDIQGQLKLCKFYQIPCRPLFRDTVSETKDKWYVGCSNGLIEFCINDI